MEEEGRSRRKKEEGRGVGETSKGRSREVSRSSRVEI